MRLETMRYTERFGSVRINDLQGVIELDSGRIENMPTKEAIGVKKIEDEAIRDIERRMAIVIPTKDEKLKLFEGVISGIPHDCLIIVVSNSQINRVDRFRMEGDTLAQFCHFSQREALILHQKDPLLAETLGEAGYTDLLGEDGLIRDGKSEGMVVGWLMAKLAKKDYVGFIDADNYFPGAVWEYAKCYAAGFSMATSPYAMVRILWHYKPKISMGMYFKKWGRASEITNKCLNSLISTKTGFESDLIKTGNAGEHAMSIRLAEILPYASGFAVEPYELVAIFEGFGGVLPTVYKTAANHGIEIFQIETRNPHLHEEKGVEHVREVLTPGLSAIYHSPICEQETKQMVIDELVSQGALKPDEEPPKPHICVLPKKVDIKKFVEVMGKHLATYSCHG